MKEQYCILNGELIKLSKAAISPLDRGFMYGDGIFDTMGAPKGVPFLFDEHFERLYDNLRQLKITLPFTNTDLYRSIDYLIKLNGLNGVDSFIRTTVTRGVNQGKLFYPSDKPTQFITAQEVPKSVFSARRDGIKCVISTVPRVRDNPLNKLKSISFLWSLTGMEIAYQNGADECLHFNTDGHLTEGSTCNVFIIKDKAISTPPLEAGILPGVIRNYLIALLKEESVTVAETNITRDELLNADEVFITSSVRGVVPVCDIAGISYQNAYAQEIQGIYFSSIDCEFQKK